MNLAELFRADRVRPRPRGHSDLVGQVGRRDPLGAIELPRQPHRAANQIMLEGIAGLHGRDGLLGFVFQFLGVFLETMGTFSIVAARCPVCGEAVSLDRSTYQENYDCPLCPTSRLLFTEPL